MSEVKDQRVAAMLDQLQGPVRTRAVTISDPAVTHISVVQLIFLVLIFLWLSACGTLS